MTLKRKEFLEVAGAVVAAPTAAALASRTQATGAVKFGTSDTAWLETYDYWAYITALESKLGRKFAAFRVNGLTPDRIAEVDKCYDHGWHWGYINGNPSPPNGDYTNYWPDTVAGQYDSWWTAWFKARLTDTRFTTSNPLHVSFFHEEEAVSEGGGLQAGTPADFAAAFRHVRNIMNACKAHFSQGGNCSMVWAPDQAQFNTQNTFYVGKCNPGVAYFDYIGADIYWKQTEPKSVTAASQWTKVHDYAKSIGKAFFTGEQGVAAEHGDTLVVKYLKDLTALLKQWGAGTSPGNVVALNFTNRVASGGDYRMDSTPAILKQYKTMAADPFFAG